MIINPYIFGTGGGGGGGLDPDAQAYIDQLDLKGYTVSPTEETQINDLVLWCKANDFWHPSWTGFPGSGTESLFDGLWLYLGSAAGPASINLADPRDLDAAHRLRFFGGITFNAYGIRGDASSGYARTYLDDSGISDTWERWMGFGSRTNSNPAAQVEMGKGLSQITRWQARSAGAARLELFSTQVGASLGTSLGSFLGWRLPTAEIKADRNGSLIINSSSSFGTLIPGLEYLLMCSNNTNTPGAIAPAYHTSRIIKHHVIGRFNMTEARAAAFNTRIELFHTNIGR
jgi:hypothetical protein